MTDEPSFDPVFAVPGHGSPLLHANGRLLSAQHGVEYPIRAGIPQFLVHPAREDDDTIRQLDRLNETCVRRGWRAALDEAYGAGSSFVRYVTDQARARFLDLLPLTPQTRVLEIGPGLAQITAALAARVASVDALEIVDGQARFAAERCRQEGLQNVRLAVGGDDGRLPYATGYFDVVVLNLVFEWCAQRCEGEAFEAVQRRLLSEMHRVLAPGGCLYLATKNRYALRYLLGKGDEHYYNLPFGNALPRRLGARLLRRHGHARPAGLLHSHDALAAMLREAGFDRMRSYWATPEMRYPERYLPTDAASVRRARRQSAFAQGLERSTRLLMPLVPARWVRHVTPGLAFVAHREGGG